jgi:hypothetical protein
VPAQFEERGENEQLVAVRRDVLNDVEHAVGNLLQRMHHAARSAKAALGPQGERLETALDDLERLLELLFDYVSPVDVEVRPSDAARIAESLVAQLRGHGLEVSLQGGAGVEVLADPRILSRSFLLLAQACAPQCNGSGALVVDVLPDPTGDRVEFVVRAAGELSGAPTAQAALAAAVAGRLIELQGGELRTRPQPTCACTVVLPAAG